MDTRSLLIGALVVGAAGNASVRLQLMANYIVGDAQSETSVGVEEVEVGHMLNLARKLLMPGRTWSRS